MMTDTTHAPRREPTSPTGPVSLTEVGDDVLAQARELDAGRSARTLTPGAGAALKQTVLALTEGSRLNDHRAPGPATLQVLRGKVRMGTATVEIELDAGQWAPIPDESHDLIAMTDATVLLTVVSGAR